MMADRCRHPGEDVVELAEPGGQPCHVCVRAKAATHKCEACNAFLCAEHAPHDPNLAT